MKDNSIKKCYLHEWDDIRMRVKKGIKRLGHDIVLVISEKTEVTKQDVHYKEDGNDT